LGEARVKIEHAFGVLKCRWGSLRGILINIRTGQDHVRVLAWIMSCILLHNLLSNLESDEDWVNNYEIRDEIADIEEDEVIGIDAERRAGLEQNGEIKCVNIFFINIYNI